MPLSVRTLAFVVAMTVPRTVAADAVVVTRAMKAGTIMEVFVEEDAILVELEVGESELRGFERLLQTADARRPLPAPIPADSMLSFLADGRPLRGTVESSERRRRVERDEVTGQASPNPGVEGVRFVVLRYPLRRHPRTLVISPPSENGYAIGDIGFVVYHEGVAVNDFRYLAAPERLELDWNDPFYSRFERRTLKRQFASPIAVFLYVEPFEVRKEVVARPLDLARFTELDVRANKPIHADRRDVVLTQISKFLAGVGTVTIDGTRVEPVLDRIHFLKRGLRMTRVVRPDEPIDGTNAIVGAIFVYPVSRIPTDVRLDWELFDHRITEVPATATDAAGPMPYVLRADDNELHWINYLKGSAQPGKLAVETPKSRISVPVVPSVASVLALVGLVLALHRRSWVLVLAAVAVAAITWLLPGPRVELPVPLGIRAPSGEEAAPTLHALLYNVYRALDFRGEEVVFDRLAQSLSGDVLEQVYLEMRKGLRLENQGGARVRVREVDLLQVEPAATKATNTLRYRVRWNATGSVGHWGHTHLRTNRYDAEVTLADIDGQWKIADIEILQEERLTAARPE